jgi:hypothetical protein
MRKKKDKYENSQVSFKYSNNSLNKEHKLKNQQSILHRHEKKLSEFANKSERIKSIDNKIKQLCRDLDKLKQDEIKFNDNEQICKSIWAKYNKLNNEYTDLLNKKSIIESGQDEIDYLLKSSNIITEYIALEEKEQNLINDHSQSNEKVNELNDLVSEKALLVTNYLTLFDNDYINHNDIKSTSFSRCKHCNVPYEIDSGFLVCISCGICEVSIDGSGDLSYKEMQDYDYRPQFTYEKRSHLDDWLRRFQSKENRIIPQEVLDKIILEATKERLKDLNLLTEEKVKRYLKKLSLNDYYDNVIGIINRINGRPPFTLTIEVEEKIKCMFQQIQEPFEKYKPSSRRNFLSYSYCIHKFFQILGLHEFAKYFPLLKSADKLRQQDDIFKKIVAEMARKDKSINWVFYPSI